MLDHQQFDLLGKKTFEKARVMPPFRFLYQMPNEACFFYLTSGRGTLISPTKKVDFQERVGVVMQCGNYLCDLIQRSSADCYEVIAIEHNAKTGEA